MCTFSFPALLTRNFTFWSLRIQEFHSFAREKQSSLSHFHPLFPGSQNLMDSKPMICSVCCTCTPDVTKKLSGVMFTVIPRIKQILRFGNGEEGSFLRMRLADLLDIFFSYCDKVLYVSKSCAEISWSRDFSGLDHCDSYFRCSFVLSQSWCNFRKFLYFYSCSGNTLENLKVVARHGSSLLCCCSLT